MSRDARHDPIGLASAVDGMTWADLQRVSRELLAELALIVESPGAQRREASISRLHAGSAPPRSTPMCQCGCPSRRDHWIGQFRAAADRDLAAGGEPRRFRGVVIRAAEDLRLARRGPQQRPDDVDRDGHTTMRDVERLDFILETYAGFRAQRAAELETARAGHIDAIAIKRIRRSNGYGIELGEPRDPEEDVVERIRSLHMQAHLSDRDIAKTLDVGRTTVQRALKDHRRFDHEEAA